MTHDMLRILGPCAIDYALKFVGSAMPRIPGHDKAMLAILGAVSLSSEYSKAMPVARYPHFRGNVG